METGVVGGHTEEPLTSYQTTGDRQGQVRYPDGTPAVPAGPSVGGARCLNLG